MTLDWTRCCTLALAAGLVWAGRPTEAAQAPFAAAPKTVAAGESVDAEPFATGAIEAAADTDARATTKGRLKSLTQKVVRDPAMKYTDPRTYRVRIGFRIEAGAADLVGISAMGPILIDWPEQTVRLLSEKAPPEAHVSQQLSPGQCAVLKMQLASLPAGESAQLERLYEITRYRMEFQLPPEELRPATHTPAEIRDQIKGVTPGLETKHPKIVSLTKSLQQESAGVGAWEEVRKFWEWNRDNIKFERGDFRGALFAVENHCGDCEELTALFVSMCRITKIGARTVWVDGTAAGHNYPEFYLLDKQGMGHWIPAQVVGPAWFGEMSEYRPIFQKGDRFYDPLAKRNVRYSPHTLRVANGARAEFKVIFEILGDQDINGPSYHSSQ